MTVPSTGDDLVKKLLILAAAASVLAYALPKLLARSNTQVHRINQHRQSAGSDT
jgi:hypothetical protein